MWTTVYSQNEYLYIVNFVTFWSFILCIIYGLCALWVCTAFVGRRKGNNLNLEKMLLEQIYTLFKLVIWKYKNQKRVSLVQIAKLARKTIGFCSSQQFSVQVGNWAAWQQEGKVSGRRRRESQGGPFLYLRNMCTPDGSQKRWR